MQDVEKLLMHFFENMNVEGGWYAVLRIPIKQGGNRKIENYVILCPKCFAEIEQDSNKIIPYSELPYFEDC